MGLLLLLVLVGVAVEVTQKAVVAVEAVDFPNLLLL
jgi:hypothetical protein